MIPSRAVLLEHLAGPLERRDYAVLLMHVGRLGEARAEMRTFMRSAGWDMQR